MIKNRLLLFIIISFSSILFSGGCPGCGGYAGGTGVEAGILGLIGASIGESRTSLLLGYFQAEFEDKDIDGETLAFQMPLNRWLTLQSAIPYTTSKGTKIMYLDEPFYYSSKGIGDLGIMIWGDIPSIKKIAPCPVDGDITKVKDFLHINFGLGATFPTGKYSYSDEWGLYPSEFQKGTGTIDYLAGFSLYKRFNKIQPQIIILYKKSGGRNPVDWWRSDSTYFKTNLIYIINPKKKVAMDTGITWSYIFDNDRNYGWGPPGMYMEIFGTEGSFISYYLSYGIEPVKNFRPSLYFSLPLYQKEEENSDKFKYSFGLNLNFSF